MAVKGELLHEGKAKRVYLTENPAIYWMEFKDDATAFDGLKKAVIAGKGYYNAQISRVFFQLLANRGLPTHFIEMVGEREMLVKAGEIIQVEVVLRNVVAGSMAKRLGIEEGTRLKRPVIEYYYKSDPLHDPIINEDHIDVLGLADSREMASIREQTLKANALLQEFLLRAGITLVDFKLEFARSGNEVLLADEISPDTCRYWDAETNDKLDKDRFRRDLGGVEEAYQEVLRRLQQLEVN